MQSSSSKTKQFSFLLLITLGVMTAFGPLTIDMYVPSLPKVQGDFGSTTSEIQLTLSFTMIGLALGQFIFGPLSDAFGRKRIAVSILITFILASGLSVFVTQLPLFLTLRLIQGLTGGGVIVIAKASAGDKFSGNALAKFLASLMVVNGYYHYSCTISRWISFIRSNLACYFHNFNDCGTYHFNWRRFSIT